MGLSPETTEKITGFEEMAAFWAYAESKSPVPNVDNSGHCDFGTAVVKVIWVDVNQRLLSRSVRVAY